MCVLQNFVSAKTTAKTECKIDVKIKFCNRQQKCKAATENHGGIFVLKRSRMMENGGKKHDQLGTAIRKYSYSWNKASQFIFSHTTIS